MKFTGNNLLALAIAVMIVVMSTATATALSLVPSNAFAASDNQEEKDNRGNNEQKADTESESESETDSDTETEETEVTEEQDQEVAENNEDTENGETSDSTSNTDDVAALESAASNNPNGNDHAPGDNSQPDRVGSHDDQTSGEGANAGGTVTDSTIPGADGQIEEDGVTLDEVTANCFGKVISHEAQEHKDPESGEEPLGEHSSDPVPEIPGNETPRQGIGNQNQGHPAAHGAFNSNFDDDDADNVNENCDPDN
ncbi:MAG: hypothetical protein WBY22_12950 [Nitrososphaeraceae archaeon]